MRCIYIFELGGIGLNLRVEGLDTLARVATDGKKRTMPFEKDGKSIVLVRNSNKNSTGSKHAHTHKYDMVQQVCLRLWKYNICFYY